MRNHFVQRPILFVLEDVKKVGQDPDQDQFGVRGLEMILMQNPILMR